MPMLKKQNTFNLPYCIWDSSVLSIIESRGLTSSVRGWLNVYF